MKVDTVGLFLVGEGGRSNEKHFRLSLDLTIKMHVHSGTRQISGITRFENIAGRTGAVPNCSTS